MKLFWTLPPLAWTALFWMLASPAMLFAADHGDASTVSFTIEPTVAMQGYDGNQCWVHARAGAIPSSDPEGQPSVVMTMQKLLLSGSDVFYPLHQTRSDNLGKTWSAPAELDAFERQRVSNDESATLPGGASVAPELVRAGDETTVCDFTPKWHAASQRLLGIGQTVWYRNNRVMHASPRGIAYAVFDSSKNRWSDWQTVKMPAEVKFNNAGAGSVQRVDLPGGDVLLPIYFRDPTQSQYSVTIVRCRFDGHTLQYVEHGDELTIPVKRGLYEPSLTQFRGRYYLTMRNDDHGYVCTSDDGLHFDTPRRWTFDDGSDLGNYNTQQHWVTHSDGLFLVYTRRGANNDHVFRHRAPLLIGQVDPESLQVRRASERVVVPEHGARLGNFGVTEVSPTETWVTVTEWMQPAGVEKHGSDNRVYVAKLKWDRPNQAWLGDSNTRPQSITNASKAWETIAPYFSPPQKFVNDFGDYASPLRLDDGTRVQTPEDWKQRRSQILAKWTSMLGEWPPLITQPDVESLHSQRRENFTQHQIRFQWTPNEKTTGYLLVPDGEGPHPAVVTVFYEPETAIGQGTPNRDFALQLARRGFVVLSIGTTEATAAKTYSLYHPRIEDAKIQPLSMLAYAAANAWHVLANRPEVDSQRIGIVGHSFGGKWAMFASCLFDKFACAAWSDPGIVFDEARPSVNYWEPWYLGYHPKPWRPRGLISDDNPARGLYPKLVAAGHDLHELHALMAPRPFLVSAGSEDPLSRWQPLNHSVAINALLGHHDRVAMSNRPDHSPNDSSNEVIYAFFTHFLRPH
ncbi:dienelactone hydrolase family protein [Novipirellula caenicola]|uniref:Dienelactone hydrolase domain-containing protein n=1 Tax=Novipirellula caenicola TaxID=1536901 RepID=A0ABP9VQE6_9BACT